MRMIAGAVLILAASVCAAGYQVAQAFNRFAGGPLPFLAWALAIGGVAIMLRAWMEELPARPAEAEKSPADKKK
ncbi:MAG TPA: hypothetical protein VML55_08390 [Planctomycetaceae bacterium]|nr:hypothetical protein [Planctomycetaceae bacterium]